MRTEDHAERNPQLAAALESAVSAYLGQFENDPPTLAAAATWIIDLLADIEQSAAERRRAAVRRMRVEGWTLQQIAAELGTSRARVHRIAEQ